MSNFLPKFVIIILTTLVWRLLDYVIVATISQQTQPNLILSDQPEMFGWIKGDEPNEWQFPAFGILQFIATFEGFRDGKPVWKIDHIGQEIEYHSFFADIHARLVNIPFNGAMVAPPSTDYDNDYCVLF